MPFLLQSLHSLAVTSPNIHHLIVRGSLPARLSHNTWLYQIANIDMVVRLVELNDPQGRRFRYHITTYQTGNRINLVWQEQGIIRERELIPAFTRLFWDTTIHLRDRAKETVFNKARRDAADE